jgi:hypothetical protein
MAFRKIIVSIVAIGLAFPTAGFAKARKSSGAQHHHTESTKHRRHYLLHHRVPHYYADHNDRRSPKWHPTKPHTGNWAD